ncbi:hypothetical protein D9756_009111 [Leucocoprinus leucothites]|uniref:S-adenosyl-L-methionine-dependent methyltransferase n=1 Tax=Leucocoprinus leucothites TaxID=201217 RepID=A0A8H5CZJ8_9AGAR|nr:hypothetical protein D9756_009111 [Leucoagaricus leucothites]
MSNYTLQNDVAPDKEIQRLDDLHDCITRYLGGRLSFAPLETLSPSSILEVGSGSGAWAIQAAKQFPTARVTAADMADLPDRVLPPNLVFEKMDLTAPLPFKPESFDIIHARLVIMHLPHGMDMLRQVAKYVKPGGWLLMEEPDDDCFWDNGGPPGPNLQALLTAWHRSMRDREAEPCIGRMLASELRGLGTFAEVNSYYVDIPLSNQSSSKDTLSSHHLHFTDDSRGVSSENQLGECWQRTIKSIIPIIRPRVFKYGITDEVLGGVLEELGDPEKRLTTRMYFTWSQKL